MPSRRSRRRAEILTVARRILLDQGLAALTYEAVGQELGVTRQAIIYWFRTKEELVRELAFDSIDAEYTALQAAVEATDSPIDAARAVLHTLHEHHAARGFADFRLMYLAEQLLPEARTVLRPEDLRTHVYPRTDRFYAAFAAALEPAVGERARTLAASIHLAGLGYCTMGGLMQASDDTMKASFPTMIDALLEALAPGLAVSRTGQA